MTLNVKTTLYTLRCDRDNHSRCDMPVIGTCVAMVPLACNMRQRIFRPELLRKEGYYQATLRVLALLH